MSPLPLAPDAEKIVSNYLRTHPDVVALGARVVGKSPDDKTTAWVRVTRLDQINATRNDDVERLLSFLLQFDCYAGDEGGQPEANLLGGTVRAVLFSMRDATHDDVVVTRVRFTTDMRRPDTSLEKARERVILTATIHMHAR